MALCRSQPQRSDFKGVTTLSLSCDWLNGRGDEFSSACDLLNAGCDRFCRGGEGLWPLVTGLSGG